MDRRSLLARLVAVLSAMLATPLAVVLGGYAWSSSRRGCAPEMWRSLGPLGDLPEDAPKRIAVSFTITDGWYQAPVERIYYARRTAASEPVVLSGRCTHLGCSVRWDRRTNDGFRCPCHGGVFDADGRVVKGPPRDALERPATRVEHGEVWVRV